MGVTFSTFLTFGAFFSWFVTGPVILIKDIGITPLYFRWLNFFCGATSCGLAAWLNGKYVKKFGMSNMLRFGWSIVLLSGILMLLGKHIIGLNTIAVMLPVTVLFFGVTFIWPNLFAIAFAPYGDIAGYAGSLYGFMQVIGGAVISASLALLPENGNTSILQLGILESSFFNKSTYNFIMDFRRLRETNSFTRKSFNSCSKIW